MRRWTIIGLTLPGLTASRHLQLASTPVNHEPS